MTDDEPADAERVRVLVGSNLARILTSHGLRHEDLAQRVRDAGLGRWEQSTVSRFVAGKRALTLEEAIVVCAALGVPLVELLHGEGEATLAGATVRAGQLRDVVTTGRISDAHRGETVLDSVAVTVAGAEAAGPAASRIADELGIPPEQVEAAAYRLWSLPVDDELGHRQRVSVMAFTHDGAYPEWLAGEQGVRRARAWQGHHTRAMTEELRAELAPKRKRKR